MTTPPAVDRPETPRLVPKPSPALLPHLKAPLFGRNDAALTFNQVLTELGSGRFPINETFRQLVRQAGIVNLWFFGKYIAGHACEYDRLDDDVHLDMCNFCQSLEYPGARGAIFMPRGVGKTKIVTELRTAWGLVRDPSRRFRISNAIADYAQGMMLAVKAIFDSNELFAWVYPEYVPPPNQKRWNDKEIVLPNRPRHSRMASVEYGGVGGAGASRHYTDHCVDDMISEQSLNSMRGSNALMEHARHWFWTNAPSLLDDTLTSRLVVVGTRYAVDDTYDDIIKRGGKFYGYPMRGIPGGSEGAWRIYYRKIIEDDRVIFPALHSRESLDEMAKDDYWTFVTQYLNDPRAAGLAEFVQYTIRVATMDFHDDEWYLSWQEGESLFHEPLSDFDVIMAVDPAATERYISAKTSRSVVGMMATHWTRRKVLFDLKVGYVEVNVLIDWMFEMAHKWRRYLRSTFLEANAGFKVLSGFLGKEQNARGIHLGLQPFSAVGEKVARIRSDLDPEFAANNILVLEPFVREVSEEAAAFPQSNKRDILDMMSAAVRRCIEPMSPEETQQVTDDDRWFETAKRSAAGY